jgi:hypothetical protein
MKYKILFPTFLLVLLLGAGAPALACFCAGLPLSESYKKSDAIFSGKVVEIRKFNKDFQVSKIRTMSIEVTEYKFEINKSFLGLDKTKTVSIFNNGTSCDFYFTKDETYLVWTYRDKRKDLVTNVCMPTKLLEEAVEEMDFLKTAEPKTAAIEKIADNAFTQAAQINTLFKIRFN